MWNSININLTITRRNLMKKRLIFASVALVLAVAVVLPQGIKELKALLTGYQEVPAVSTAANGEFRARISNDGTQIDYELSYSDLEGAVQQSHIHLGQEFFHRGRIKNSKFVQHIGGKHFPKVFRSIL